MEPNNIAINNSCQIDNNKEQSFFIKTIKEQDYLYPNGHRVTNQMRWFRSIRDQGLKSDIVA